MPSLRRGHRRVRVTDRGYPGPERVVGALGVDVFGERGRVVPGPVVLGPDGAELVVELGVVVVVSSGVVEVVEVVDELVVELDGPAVTDGVDVAGADGPAGGTGAGAGGSGTLTPTVRRAR